MGSCIWTLAYNLKAEHRKECVFSCDTIALIQPLHPMILAIYNNFFLVFIWWQNFVPNKNIQIHVNSDGAMLKMLPPEKDWIALKTTSLLLLFGKPWTTLTHWHKKKNPFFSHRPAAERGNKNVQEWSVISGKCFIAHRRLVNKSSSPQQSGHHWSKEHQVSTDVPQQGKGNENDDANWLFVEKNVRTKQTKIWKRKFLNANVFKFKKWKPSLFHKRCD